MNRSIKRLNQLNRVQRILVARNIYQGGGDKAIALLFKIRGLLLSYDFYKLKGHL